MDRIITVPRGSAQGVDVRGEVLLGLMEAFGPFKSNVVTMLNKVGISNPLAGEWYPLEVLLQVFREIEERIGPSTMAQVGLNVALSAVWPNIHNFEQAISTIDIAYHMNHRRDKKELFDHRTGQIVEGFIGHDVFYPPRGDDRIAVFVCGSFYPCDFDRGMAEGLARRFPPSKTALVRVEHDDTQPCRKKGGDSCTYKILW